MAGSGNGGERSRRQGDDGERRRRSGGQRDGTGGRRSDAGGQRGGGRRSNADNRRHQGGRSGERGSGRRGQQSGRGRQRAGDGERGARGDRQRGGRQQTTRPGGGGRLPADARTTVGYVVVALAVMGLGVGLMVGTVSAIGEDAVTTEPIEGDSGQPSDRDLTAEEEAKMNTVEQKQFRQRLVQYTVLFIPLLTVVAGGFGGLVVGRHVDAELGTVAVAAGVAALVGATLFMFIGGYVAAEQFPEYEPAPELDVRVPPVQYTFDAGTHFSNSLGAGIAGGIAGALAGVCGRKIG